MNVDPLANIPTQGRGPSRPSRKGRRRSGRLLLVVLALAVLAGGLLGYRFWSASSLTVEEYVESGRAYYEDGRYPQAVIQLLNAIRQDGRHREAHLLLADAFVGQGDLLGAARTLNRLLESYPDDVEASIELGNLYLTGGASDPDFFREAGELADRVLEVDPDNVPALILSGNATAGLRDFEASIRLFERATVLEPGNTAAFLGLGAAQGLQSNFPQAEQAFLRALEIDPTALRTMISLANYYGAVGDSEGAMRMLEEAFEQYPSDRSAYLQLAGFHYRQGRFDEAERVLRSAAESEPANPDAYLVLTDLYFDAGRRSEAMDLLRDLKGRFPGTSDISVRLAGRLIGDDPAEARREIDEILAQEPGSPIGNILLGQLQFLEGDLAAAETTLSQPAALESGYPQPRFILGSIALRAGDVDRARDEFERSLASNADYVPARLSLAEVFLNTGRPADARRELRTILDARPDYAPARVAWAALNRAEGNLTEAGSELEALLAEQPENASVHRQLGAYYEARLDIRNAEAGFLRALELRPGSFEDFQALILFYLRNEQAQRAAERLVAIPEAAKTPAIHELLGLAYFAGGQFGESESAYRRALELEPNRWSSSEHLVALYLATSRTDDALAELNSLTGRNPGHAVAYTTRGMIYESRGDVDTAITNYTQALELDPTLEAAGNNLAYLLAEEGRDLQTALNWAQTVRRSNPNSPSAADTLGWVYYKMGSYVLAREQLLFAVSRQPEKPVFQYHLAMIYLGTGQTPEAGEALRRAIASPDEFRERDRARASLSQIEAAR